MRAEAYAIIGLVNHSRLPNWGLWRWQLSHSRAWPSNELFLLFVTFPSIIMHASKAVYMILSKNVGATTKSTDTKFCALDLLMCHDVDSLVEHLWMRLKITYAIDSRHQHGIMIVVIESPLWSIWTMAWAAQVESAKVATGNRQAWALTSVLTHITTLNWCSKNWMHRTCMLKWR